MRLIDPKPLPPILKRRLRDDASPAERREAFNSLVGRYGLSELYNKMIAEKTEATRQSSASATFWEALATSLMRDHVKAFRPKLIKTDKTILFDWLKAGGDVQGFWENIDRYRRHFYEAQLVWLIRCVQQKKDCTRAWAFRWLANEAEAGGPNERERRAALLPRRYQKRSTPRSLKEAFMIIDRSVRVMPSLYLPNVGLGPSVIDILGTAKRR